MAVSRYSDATHNDFVAAFVRKWSRWNAERASTDVLRRQLRLAHVNVAFEFFDTDYAF